MQRTPSPDSASPSASSRSPSPSPGNRHHKRQHASRKERHEETEEEEVMPQKSRRSRAEASHGHTKKRHSADKMASREQEPPWVQTSSKHYDDFQDASDRRGRSKQVSGERRHKRTPVTSSDASSASRSSSSASRSPVKRRKDSATKMTSHDAHAKPTSTKQRRNDVDDVTHASHEQVHRKRRDYDDGEPSTRNAPRRYDDEERDARGRYEPPSRHQDRKRSKETQRDDVSARDEYAERSRSHKKRERDESLERDDVTVDAKSSRYESSHADYRLLFIPHIHVQCWSPHCFGIFSLFVNCFKIFSSSSTLFFSGKRTSRGLEVMSDLMTGSSRRLLFPSSIFAKMFSLLSL